MPAIALGPAHRDTPAAPLMVPFSFLRTGDRLGRAVLKIQRADAVSGTGFLVAPNILLTNHHVVPCEKIAASAQAIANFETPTAQCELAPIQVASLRPAELFLTNPELDVTFCAVDDLEHLGNIPLERDDHPGNPGDQVFMIQHPAGGTKKLTLRESRLIAREPEALRYSCRSEPGASGSPVFDSAWRLIAIHRAALPGPGAPLNEGVRPSAISAWLDQSTTANASAHKAKIRSLFRGCHPAYGYFGARALDHDAPAQNPEHPTHSGKFDLGYWDLAWTLADQNGPLDEVAETLARTRLDVWILAGVDDHAAEDLCDEVSIRSGDYTQWRHSSPLTRANRRPDFTVVHRAESRISFSQQTLATRGISCLNIDGQAAPGSPPTRLCLLVDSPPRRSPWWGQRPSGGFRVGSDAALDTRWRAAMLETQGTRADPPHSLLIISENLPDHLQPVCATPPSQTWRARDDQSSLGCLIHSNPLAPLRGVVYPANLRPHTTCDSVSQATHELPLPASPALDNLRTPTVLRLLI